MKKLNSGGGGHNNKNHKPTRLKHTLTLYIRTSACLTQTN